MRMSSIMKENEPNFLFKGKLKCGKCNRLFHFTNGLLQCNKGCKPYAKNSVIEATLDIIIDDAFENSKDGFNNFCNTIEEKLIYLRNCLQKLRNTKVSLLQQYLSNKDKRYIQIVQDNQDAINTLLNKIATIEGSAKTEKEIQNKLIAKMYSIDTIERVLAATAPNATPPARNPTAAGIHAGVIPLANSCLLIYLIFYY